MLCVCLLLSYVMVEGTLGHLDLILLEAAVNHTVMQTVKHSQTDIHTEILELQYELANTDPH